MQLSDEQTNTAANQPVVLKSLAQSECCNLDLNDLVVDLAPMLTRLVGPKIQLQHELDAEIGVVWGDASLLEQVIINLVVSAREAMPDGGTLSIYTETIEDMLDAHRTPKGVRLTVSDSGDGTDAPTLTHSCDDPNLTSEPISTSLMAAYCFVKMHNGAISINSELGHGTDVNVELPFSSITSEPAERHTSADLNNAKTILLVEDIYGARSRVYCILTKAGYTVLNAQSGQNAIDILSASTSEIDLCLFDVDMPEVNGSQALDIIQQRKLDMPVIFIAANFQEIVVKNSKHKHLFKPFSRANILSQVRSCIGDVGDG